ncbi:GNAT family N-acetyltransferase [Amycolatopsis sp. NPDC048633]|uniref:GNAT family N-acetyltransferase n=1 Tax=Amycolatopsis sp. NPDC048633 TaxID=3157095 RepID=UPI0033FDEC11
MTEIRPVRAADAPRLTGLLAQLGYPGELDAVTTRLAAVLGSATQQVLVATPAGGSRIDGYVGVERRPPLLEQDERVEVTGLVVDAAARRSGIGRALMRAAEQWAARHDLHTVVLRSNVARPESHPFYEGIGYRRKATSHLYRKEV